MAPVTENLADFGKLCSLASLDRDALVLRNPRFHASKWLLPTSGPVSQTIIRPCRDAGNEHNASGEPAPGAAFVELLLPKNTPTPPLLKASPNEHLLPTNRVAPPPRWPNSSLLKKQQKCPKLNLVQKQQYLPKLSLLKKAAISSEKMDHDHTEHPASPEQLAGENTVSEESPLVRTLYPPPRPPTATYRPPGPPLSTAPITKPTSAVNALASKLKRLSWHPPEQHRRASAPPSPATNGAGRASRPASAASSDASSPCSANSATVQVPQPGTSAYRKKSNHRRQQSDPKYLRFISAISEGQNQKEPERCVGYPGLVSHMAETQHLVFRRFDSVHVRLLLYLQDQISQLETQLRSLDERNSETNGMHNGTFRGDADQSRVEIMESLRRLVGEYDTMILAFSRMQETKASERTVGHLKDWLRKYSAAPGGRQSPARSGAIARAELEWLEKADDLTNLSANPAAASATAELKQLSLTRLFPSRKRL